MKAFALTGSPIYPAYRTLETTRFRSRVFLSWDLDTDPIDAGVDHAIASVLAGSWRNYKVLFFGGPLTGSSLKQWYSFGEQTFVVRLPGEISRLCISSEPETIVTLFEQVGFDWTQRGQLVILLSADTHVAALEPARLAEDLAQEQIDKLPTALGYVRPGDDGDFAELGFLSSNLLSEWVNELERLSAQANISLRRQEP